VNRKKDYPNLWRMARDLLGIPATSTPAERMFSRAGMMYTKSRNRLLGDIAEALMTLGSWWGGEGLPGVKVPIFHNETDEEGGGGGGGGIDKQQLQNVMKHEGKLSFQENEGWETDYDDDESGEYDDSKCEQVGSKIVEDVEDVIGNNKGLEGMEGDVSEDVDDEDITIL
jgi:hypothetical protein